MSKEPLTSSGDTEPKKEVSLLTPTPKLMGPVPNTMSSPASIGEHDQRCNSISSKTMEQKIKKKKNS